MSIQRIGNAYVNTVSSALADFASSEDYPLKPLMKPGKKLKKKTKKVATPPNRHFISPPRDPNGPHAPYDDNVYMPRQRKSPKAPYELPSQERAYALRASAENALDEGLRYQPCLVCEDTIDVNYPQDLMLRELGVSSKAELDIARDTAKFRAQGGRVQRDLRELPEMTHNAKMWFDIVGDRLK